MFFKWDSMLIRGFLSGILHKHFHVTEKLEKIMVPKFNGSSLIILPLEEVISHSMSFRIWFKSTKPDGKASSLCHLYSYCVFVIMIDILIYSDIFYLFNYH